MTYTPKTEDQLADEDLLPEGIYDFEVMDSDDRPSKKGNAMFTLKLCVYDVDGKRRHIFDYMAMGNSFGERKLRHAAVCCGLLEIYNSGNLQPHTFLGCNGKVLLKKQDGTKDGLGVSVYPPKNVVADYLTPEEAVETKSSKDLIGDDLPF